MTPSQLWEKLSPKQQYEVRSGIKTFATSFVLVLGSNLQLTTGALTKDVLLSIVGVAVRAAIKAVWVEETKA